MKTLALFLLATAFLPAQQPAADSPQPATVSGVIKDAGTGAPIPNAKVEANIVGAAAKAKQFEATTDSQGNYSFNDLPAGQCRLTVTVGMHGEVPTFAHRTVNLTQGQKVKVDIPLAMPGTISGKVMDENGEPLPGVRLFLVGREYFAGELRSLIKSMTESDDQGSYTLKRADAGRAFVVYADSRSQKIEAISPIPDDTKMRRQVLVPTFYPNSRDMNGAGTITLRSGEHAQAIDIKMARAPGYCVDGTVSVMGAPGALSFFISRESPSFGTGARGGTYSPNPGGTTGADGKFRICELTPGAYRLETMHWTKNSNGPGAVPPPIGEMIVTVGERDIHDVKLQAMPPQGLSGEVVWDGTPPEKPVTGKVSISLEPLVRSHFSGEKMDARTSIPDTFTMESVPTGEYTFYPPRAPEGLYVKDIIYAGNSVLHGKVTIGGGMANSGLRVIVANGASKISVNVTEKEGVPAGGVNVVAMPDVPGDEAVLAGALMQCATDQDGNCTLQRLAPGKYHLLAVSDLIDLTPELMDKLMKSRSKAFDVDVAAGGSAQAAIKLTTI